jgi:hypothetical protein
LVLHDGGSQSLGLRSFSFHHHLTMQSLRTRRSQRRGPPSKLARATNQPIPRENRVKSRVDDKIKQRISMRYAEISSPTELVPPVPIISHSLSEATHQRAPSPGISFEGENEGVDRGRSAREDRRLLEAEEFDPEACQYKLQPCSSLF